MIVCDLLDLPKQTILSDEMLKAFQFIQQASGTDLPDGRVEIDGVKIYGLVQSYNSKLENDHPKFEAHRRYLDVQFIVSGQEQIGWAAVGSMQNPTDYNEIKDVFHGSVGLDKITFVKLRAGQLAVLYPTDGHAPGLSDGASSPVKKIVVKIQIA
jgi:YhcH/YjgK/YiaL family protein